MFSYCLKFGNTIRKAKKLVEAGGVVELDYDLFQ